MLLSTARRRIAAPHGSVLLLVIILVVVITIGAIAALNLARQESAAVSQRIKADLLLACSDAASRKLLAEFAVYGGGHGQHHPHGHSRHRPAHVDSALRR